MTESTLCPPLVGVMKDYNIKGFADDYVNPRGLPRMEFIDEDVAAYVKSKGGETAVQKKTDEMFSKYKLYEYKMMQSKDNLKQKIPEITKTVEMVKQLKARVEADEELEAHFELSEVVYAEAVIKDKPKTVGLWLGANVMVEYSFDEAIKLLTGNLATAKESLEQVLEDLAFLYDQTNICEVNINRLHNYLIQERRKENEAAAQK
eukprot:TRINITY_DN27281_c0_g1_i1.p1 TRINITY_DN27281_c0_g1~~TRINITY_DN27281_c0_g1_i1.p1  ORF type:complete len:220 (+),score=158.61 TRINITY_DN27281_c0_g1_i1:48-662(+)